jgi:CP family cyanate transporter-like MFS transporter
MPPRDSAPGSTVPLLCLLWLAGAAIRVPILAVPPVIPLIHDALALSETQIGLLIGLPPAMFALAAVPGSLLIARLGVIVTAMAGLALAAVAAAGRGGAETPAMLYAATLVMGFGVAITQPALPRLVRDWMPRHIALGTAVYTNGMLLGATGAVALTIPVVLPLVGQSWRVNFIVWAVPVLLAAILIGFGPRAAKDAAAAQARWWPDWRSPTTWLLGLAFGGNNSIFYACNAFLPDFLAAQGRADLITAALGALNAAQVLASFVLLAAGERLHRRMWPYLVFGTLTLAAFAILVTTTGLWIVVSAALIGFALAVTFVMLLALPPVLSPPHDVHRTAAGMFTISYSCAVVVPTASGAIWDVTGLPWATFIPLGLCAGVLTVLGAILSRQHPARG